MRHIALVSYPRSGNSLLRSLVEACSGVLTGSDSRPQAPEASTAVSASTASSFAASTTSTPTPPTSSSTTSTSTTSTTSSSPSPLLQLLAASATVSRPYRAKLARVLRRDPLGRWFDVQPQIVRPHGLEQAAFLGVAVGGGQMEPAAPRTPCPWP